jgi:hypothetical protein
MNGTCPGGSPSSRRLLLLGCGVTAAIVAVVALADRPTLLFVDPGFRAEALSLDGLFSTLGLWGWVASAAVALFAAGFATGAERRLLFVFGLLSVLLAIDDAVMLHEGALRAVVGDNTWVYAAGYLVLVTVLLLLVRDALPGEAVATLVLAAALLAGSMALDVAADVIGLRSGAETVLEDSFRLLGIVYWLAFSVDRSRAAVVTAGAAPGAPPSGRADPASTP